MCSDMMLGPASQSGCVIWGGGVEWLWVAGSVCVRLMCEDARMLECAFSVVNERGSSCEGCDK